MISARELNRDTIELKKLETAIIMTAVKGETSLMLARGLNAKDKELQDVIYKDFKHCFSFESIDLLESLGYVVYTGIDDKGNWISISWNDDLYVAPEVVYDEETL